MRLLTALALLPTAASLLFAGGCALRMRWDGNPTAWHEATETIVVPAAGRARVAVDSHHGSIRVTGDPGADAVTVVARKRTGGRDEADARTAQAHLRIAQRIQDDEIAFEVEWDDDWSARDWSAAVDFEVTVPARFGATLTSHHGNVVAHGLAGGVLASSHHGTVELREVAGRVDGRSHHGEVTCTTSGEQVVLRSHHGDVELTTTALRTIGSLRSHHGNLRIDLPAGACGTVCGSGSLDAFASGADANSMVVRIDDDDFVVELRDPSVAELEADTHHGCVRLR